MDFATTVIIIIVTALTNTLVIGALGSYFKRGIERSFDEKMEAYKADLQREVLEHQTKFARSYPKTLEVIETFIQKFRVYYNGCSALGGQIKLSILGALHPNLETSLRKDTIEFFLNHFDEPLYYCRFYFADNRFYLPDNVSQEIDDVIDKMENINRYMATYLRNLHKTPEEILQLMGKIIDMGGQMRFPDEEAFKKIDVKDAKGVITFIELLEKELNRLSEKLENLYKSVTDTRDQVLSS